MYRITIEENFQCSNIYGNASMQTLQNIFRGFSCFIYTQITSLLVDGHAPHVNLETQREEASLCTNG